MKIGLVGPSYQAQSLSLDAQRSINLFPNVDESQQGVTALYGTPGLSLFATAGVGPIRGGFATHDGRCFVISKDKLYEILSNGSASLIGTLLTTAGIVSFEENGLQLGVCDGTYLYIYTYLTSVFAQVTDVDLPSCGTLTFIDGYFVVNKNDSGQFFISALYDGTSWDALDFATAESSPDDLIRVINAVGQLWLFGSKTTEIWTNTGATAFPFERIAGAKMEVGILAPHSAVAVDNSVFWIGRDAIGSGVVYRARGFSPQRISTHAIELLIQSAPTPSSLRAFTYQQDGHTFYIITGGDMNTSLAYDISTQQWHERAYFGATGEFETHLATCAMFAFNKQLVGSRLDGKIYEMSLDFYSDDDNPLVAERTYTTLSDEGKRIRYNELIIDMEEGVGLQSGQGVDPLISLATSRDGGKTFSGFYTTSFGKVGKFLRRAVFRRLGYAMQMTFKIRITDPVKRALIGSYLK